MLGFAQQMDLPVSFDVAGVDYGVIGFEGAEASTIEADPTDATNTVVKVIKSATAQPWAGTTVTNADGDGLATPIPFTASSAKMSLRVWSPDAGIPVRLKVEVHGVPSQSVETDAFTTVAGQWETLVFNFENEGSGTAALNLAYTYDKASVFFNYGTNGATAGEKTYYFDDLELAILPPAIYNVTFQVDMQNVTGFTTPEVNGTFNSWCGNCNSMTDANSDGIWEVTLPLEEGNYEYKFSYDAWAGQEALTVGSSCTITSFGNTNRTLALNADVVLPVVCWNSCVGCNVIVLDQMDLPVTFEDSTVEYGVIGFEGADASTIEEDPTDASNTVVKVIKSATAQPWAGTTVTNADGDGLASAIPFTSTEKQMSVRVWSPDAGIPVRLKVEDHLDPTRSVETDAITTSAGAWETLIFNFANQAAGTAAYNAAYTYDKASVFFNYGTNGATAGEKTYYFDDLEFYTGVVVPDTFDVTFQIDMQNVTGFTTPEVNGTFNSWCGNCNSMTDTNSDGIWEVTLALPAGNYEYKYSYDAWAGQEALTEGSSCTITSFGNTNRTLTLNADVVLPAVCWGSCVGCNVIVLNQMDLPVTFEDANVEYGVIGFEGAEASSIEVDPTDATNTVVKVIKSATAQPWAGTTVTNAAEEGLASAIPFTSTETQMTVRVWSPDAGIPVRLKVEDHSDPTVSVETEATTTTAGAWETLTFDFANEATGTATLNLANTYDKASVFFNYGTNGATAGEKTYYFDDLAFGSGSVQTDFNVTFQVDMQNVTGFTTPEVNGIFNNWCGGCAPMSDANSDGIWELTIPLAAGTYEFKYAYDNWAGQETLAPGGSCVLTTGAFTNRIITVSADITLPVVCWNSCSACDNPTGPFNVTFQVDMRDVATFTTPEVNGTFNNWCGGCAPMTDANSDGIWEIIIPLPADTFEYKFANDNWAGQESLTSGSSCTITTDGFTNRQIIVTENIVLPAVCWGSCDPCLVGFEMLNTNSLDIYPNPAQGQLNIALNQQVSDKLNLRVMDASGRVVFSSINNPAQKLSVDTKNLANGVYFLQVSSNEIQVSKSFIVQN